MNHTQENSAQVIAQLLEKAREALNAKNPDAALQYTIEAKKYRVSTENLDYVRALSFLEKNQLANAREALLEELRWFPHNSNASNVLSQVQKEESKSNQAGQQHRTDPEFVELLTVIRPYTMLPEGRLFSLFSLAKQVSHSAIQGNFVECGVAGGGSTAMLSTLIRRYSSMQRLVFAFDSFEGMPEPGQHDFVDNMKADDTGWGTGTCAAPEASVRKICSELGTSDLVKPVKGYFEHTLPMCKSEIGAISFLHIDCDWYESAKTVFHNLYDQLSPGAAVQVDDYGYWSGMKKALDELCQERRIRLTLHDVGGAAWFQKL